MRDKQIMLSSVGRAEIDKFIDVILYTGFAQYGIGDQRGAHASQCEAVGLGDIEDVFAALPTPAGWHVLDDDVRIPWNVLAEEVGDRAGSHVGRAGRRPAEHDRDCLAGEEMRLSETRAGVQCTDTQQGDNGGEVHDLVPAGRNATKPSYSSPR